MYNIPELFYMNMCAVAFVPNYIDFIDSGAFPLWWTRTHAARHRTQNNILLSRREPLLGLLCSSACILSIFRRPTRCICGTEKNLPLCKQMRLAEHFIISLPLSREREIDGLLWCINCAPSEHFSPFKRWECIAFCAVCGFCVCASLIWCIIETSLSSAGAPATTKSITTQQIPAQGLQLGSDC